MCLLEFLQGIHGSLAHLTVHRAFIIFQVFQPLLQQLHIVSLGTVPQGFSGDLHGGGGARGYRHGRGRSVLRTQGGTGHNQFPGNGVCRTVGGQAVLFLEGAYRSDGIRIICAGRSSLQVAQIDQLLLQLCHSFALVALLHGNFLHRAQGSDAGFCTRGILRLAGIQERLDIRVHDAGGRVIILLLESDNGFFRARSEFAVRAARQEAQLNQRFLQGSYFRAFRAFLQDDISAGVLFRAQGHNRRGSGGRLHLFDFLQHNVVRLHIAGILLVLHLSPGAFHSVYRDLRVRGDLLQQRAPGRAAGPQIHLHLRLRGIRVAADGFQRFFRCLFRSGRGKTAHGNSADKQRQRGNNRHQRTKADLQLRHTITSHRREKGIVLPPTFVYTIILSHTLHNVNELFIFL